MNTTEFGSTAMHMALDLLAGGEGGEDFTIATPVTPANVADFVTSK